MEPRSDNRATLTLREIAIDRMDGIRTPYAIDMFCPGINLVHGPNGIGKSRTAKAIQSLLWPGTGASRDEIHGHIEVSGDAWRVALEGGRVRYQRNDVPETTQVPVSLPDEHHARYVLTLHELLLADNRDFAREILREAAGGLDLDDVGEALGVSARPPRLGPLVGAIQEATRDISSLRQAERDLERREESLGELRITLNRAIAASERARLLRAALKHHDARDQQSRQRTALDAFPGPVRRITGRDLDEVRALRTRLTEVEGQRRDLSRSIEAANRELSGTGLDGVSVPSTLIGSLKNYRDQARQHQANLDQIKTRIVMTSGVLEIARDRIGTALSGEQLSRLDADGLIALAAHVEEKREAWNALHLQKETEAWLGPFTESGNLDDLRQAVDILQQYIGAERSRPGGQPGYARWLVLGAAGVILAQAAMLAMVTTPWLIVLALLAVPVAFLGMSLDRGQGEESQRLREEYMRLSLTPPEGWTLEQVQRRLTIAQRDVALATLEDQKFQRWQALASKREGVAAVWQALERDHAELLETYGSVADDLDADSLRAIAHALEQWRRAGDDLRQAEAEHVSVASLLQESLDAINAHARFFTSGAVSDISQAVAAIAECETRVLKAESLSASLERDQRRLDDEIRPGIADLDGQIADIFESAGLANGDDAGLQALCAQVEAFVEAKQRCDEADGVVKAWQEELKEHPDLVEASREDIDRQLEEAAALSGRREELQREISTIEETVRRARQETRLEQAIVEEAAAIERLHQNRKNEYATAAARRLFSTVRHRDRQQNRPAVFRVAEAYFARFTGGAYRLVMSEGQDADFLALDTVTRETRPLDQLSSGTRVQLLLAVRLAFIDVTEGGVRLPIILDETLGNTDDIRAIAVIDAAIAIASGGRQVLYFTAQQDEIGKWLVRLNAHDDAPASQVIDLAAIRRGTDASSPSRLDWSEAIFAIPEIDERATYEDLHALLGVPPVDVWSTSASDCHVWYLIPDAEALVKLHRRGVRYWGEYLALSQSGDLAGIQHDRMHEIALSRAQVIETVCRQWQFGRPRPVTTECLDASSQITKRFRDEVVACAKVCEWDGRALIDALATGAVSGFRRAAVEGLEEWFREHEHIIDDLEPRTEGIIRAAAIAAGNNAIEQGVLDEADIDALLMNMAGAPVTAA